MFSFHNRRQMIDYHHQGLPGLYKGIITKRNVNWTMRVATIVFLLAVAQFALGEGAVFAQDISPQADLSVTKSDDIDPIIQRGDLTYTIVVTNNGPDAAENVTVSDTLPAGTTFNYASQSKGTCAISYPLYHCQIGTLQVGESATMTVHIRPDVPGVITNTVSVASSTSDPDTSNNSDSEDTTVYVLQADLSVTKSDDVDPVTDGEPLTYTVVVTNNGPDAAENVTLSDTLPTDASFMFATITQGTCAIGFPLLQCQMGTINAGGTVTLTIRVEPNAPGVITNTVSIASDTDDPDTNNNSDSEDTTVNGIPTVMVANGQCSAINLASGTVNLALYDVDGDPLSLTLASNTNTGLIPDGNIVLGGSGNNRTVSVTTKPKKSGTAILTFNLSDGIVTIPFTITVKVGTDKDEILNGTTDADMIFGLNGKNTINGLGGNDLLCGGNSVDTIDGGDGNDIIEGQNGNDFLDGGNDNDILRGNLGDDILTGSAGADFFSGGAGTDMATDFNIGQGDIHDGTIP